MNKLKVFKIGGHVIDNEEALSNFLSALTNIEGKKILVHGGGAIGDEFLKKMNIPIVKHLGRRITDQKTMKVVSAVYAGYINKKIVSNIQSMNKKAFGLTGVDGKLLNCKKRAVQNGIDFGYVGDIITVNTELIDFLITQFDILVIAPIADNNLGQLLNINADTVAATIAISLCEKQDIELYYCFEHKGLLAEKDNALSVIPTINSLAIEKLIAEGIINDGMIPKIKNCLLALKGGVSKVKIGSYAEIIDLISQTKNIGTTIFQ